MRQLDDAQEEQIRELEEICNLAEKPALQSYVYLDSQANAEPDRDCFYLLSKLYGQLRQPGSEKSNEARDNFEMALLLAALEAEKPIFCINRGMLLLNVALGGTLYQDLKSRQQCEHFDFWHRSVAAHPVELDPDSFLAKQLKTDVLTVNSIHRQAIDNLGKRLWICADSPDGFPEALEMEDYPFCLAVQWNPEFMTRKTPVQRKLFQGFVDACRK